ncbi:hypothetical protein GCM10027449_05870 [Sinomonas notoginsengisoli]|uniref:hypothetical protein n=1 Tax=Sinomonas notoginsengisoli TaxID=1457311 RepID=UPI001F44E7FD|nr:hypothetical protein [Sinomonas notoginsengisoli]
MTETERAAKGTYSAAASKAGNHRTIIINFEGVGTVRLPPTDELAFLGGIGVLAAAGIIEWPVAGVLAAGHLISRISRNKTLKAFGDALEEA